MSKSQSRSKRSKRSKRRNNDRPSGNATKLSKKNANIAQIGTEEQTNKKLKTMQEAFQGGVKFLAQGAGATFSSNARIRRMQQDNKNASTVIINKVKKMHAVEGKLDEIDFSDFNSDSTDFLLTALTFLIERPDEYAGYNDGALEYIAFIVRQVGIDLTFCVADKLINEISTSILNNLSGSQAYASCANALIQQKKLGQVKDSRIEQFYDYTRSLVKLSLRAGSDKFMPALIAASKFSILEKKYEAAAIHLKNVCELQEKYRLELSDAVLNCDQYIGVISSLGNVLQRLNRNDEAVKFRKEWVEIDDSNPKALLCYGISLVLVDKHKMAIDYLRKVIDLDREGERSFAAYYAFATALLGQDRKVEAIEILTAGLEIMKKKLKEAPEELSNIEHVRDIMDGMLFTLLLNLETKSESERAEYIVYFQDFDELDDEPDNPVKVELRMKFASCLDKNGKQEDAIAEYGRILEQNQSNIEAHLLLAFILRERGENQKANYHVSVACFIDPDRINELIGCYCEEYPDFNESTIGEDTAKKLGLISNTVPSKEIDEEVGKKDDDVEMLPQDFVCDKNPATITCIEVEGAISLQDSTCDTQLHSEDLGLSKAITGEVNHGNTTETTYEVVEGRTLARKEAEDIRQNSQASVTHKQVKGNNRVQRQERLEAMRDKNALERNSRLRKSSGLRCNVQALAHSLRKWGEGGDFIKRAKKAAANNKTKKIRGISNLWELVVAESTGRRRVILQKGSGGLEAIEVTDGFHKGSGRNSESARRLSKPFTSAPNKFTRVRGYQAVRHVDERQQQ